MTKPKPQAKLPDFEKMSLEEIAEFWETHDSADYWDLMEDATEEVRFQRPRDKIVSVRISEEDLYQLKQVAAERGMGYTTLIRTWIKEKLRELQATKR